MQYRGTHAGTTPGPGDLLKISIVTAVYNRVATIRETIESVAAQSYHSIEHIVQDGCSTDGTLDAIQITANHRVNLVSEPDSGIYDGINRGIKRANGDVIGLMHSDDLFAHEGVLMMIADALSDLRIDGVYGDLQYVAADNPMHVVRHWQAGKYQPIKLKRGWMPPHPTLYLRREIFDQWGLYDTSYQIAADYDAMLRYLVKGQIKLAYIPEVLVKMRVGGESNRSLGRVLLKSREDLQAVRQNSVGGMVTVAYKNLSKLPQFFKR